MHRFIVHLSTSRHDLARPYPATRGHKGSCAVQEQLPMPPEASSGVEAEVGVSSEPSLPEPPAAMETETAAAADHEDVDIEGEPVTAAEHHPEQPSSCATAPEASEAAVVAAAETPENAEAVTPAPAKAAASAAEREQPPSRGRGSRGRRGGRGGRGRGRSKPKGKARATGNSSPRAPSEQDQAEFADQLDQSPSHAEGESGDPQAEQADDKDVSVSDATDQPKQPQKRSSLRKGKSDASQASEQFTGAKSRASKEGNASATPTPDNTKAPPVQSSAAPEADQAKKPKSAATAAAKAQKPKEARTAAQDGKEEGAADEPPTKRPRRAGSGGSLRAAENGKSKGRRPQARHGVVESESDDNSDVDIEGRGRQADPWLCLTSDISGPCLSRKADIFWRSQR